MRAGGLQEQLRAAELWPVLVAAPDLVPHMSAGLAAGFDKHAEIIEPMMRMGFGFVEVGECWGGVGKGLVCPQAGHGL